MTRDDVLNEYFEWLCSLIEGNIRVSYRKLLIYLHNTEFRYIILNDGNRAEDGLKLRYRFSDERKDIDPKDYLDEPCSVLEMMVALSIRCETDIMDDKDAGNRTYKWFWGMIDNLGLSQMTDNHFSKNIVSGIIDRFLDREYDPNGAGGLFTVEKSGYDLRAVEIWYQMCWYLDELI